MDDYTREMMDLKTLVTRTLEKKGVLAKIRAELRASVFEAIEEEDKTIEKEEGLPPALLGSCNDRAKQLHASPSGRLLTALISEYLDWAQLSHTLKVYLPECNLQKDFWKAELKEFSSKNGYDLNRNGDSAPLLLDVLEGFLKYEVCRRYNLQNLSQARGTGRRYTPESESLTNLEARNMRRPSSSSVAGGLPPLGRPVPVSQASDRRGGSSMSSYRRDEYNWRYDSDELPEDVARASTALENLQLDRKARNLTSSWRFVLQTLQQNFLLVSIWLLARVNLGNGTVQHHRSRFVVWSGEVGKTTILSFLNWNFHIYICSYLPILGQFTHCLNLHCSGLL
ncbi:hypothetical protein HYC85_013953 [Camellia sinensis]|uniref:LisH domain-containing protein n=1 Tax=Camellia sinensis TaxID=4442 RepID=A0A7J7H876_CAMSI|nr:hypothetical protein HYC85_013953 [Camellia sinensis]